MGSQPQLLIALKYYTWEVGTFAEMKCLRWDARLAVGGPLKPFCTIMGNKEATAMHSRWALPVDCQNHLPVKHEIMFWTSDYLTASLQ